ncbi:MAG: insulinase family protein [Acidobacteria bacterium]|nr:insulinase family protein [Acidobacteriota bacterium]
MRNIQASVAVIFIVLFGLLPPASLAQSGRGRAPNPARDPQPANAPPVTVPETTSVIKQEQAANLSRFVLKNGITVIINEQHATPITATVACFKAGSRDETAAMSGASALLARLLLRATQFKTAEQLLNQTRAIGAVMDAQAGYDNTAFYLLAPPDQLKGALALQADMLQHPAFAADDISREIPMLEASMNQSLEVLRHRQSAFAKLFDGALNRPDEAADSGLQRLINLTLAPNYSERLGQPNAVINAAQLMSFYQAQFRPDNLIITVVGDVSTFNTLVEIQRLYGTFKTPAPVAEPSTYPSTPATNKASDAADPKTAKAVASDARKAKSTTAAQAKPVAAETAKKPDAPAAAQTEKQQAVSSQTVKQQTSSSTTPTTKSANANAPTANANAPTASGKASTPTPTADSQQATPAPQTPLRYGNARGNASQSVISVGYRFGKLEAKEQATIEVLAALLGQGRGSRLHRSLVDGQGFANRVEANYFALADDGLLAVQMLIAPQQIDRVESAFFKDVNRLRREIPAAAELTRAKMLLEKRFFDHSNTCLDRAWLLTRAEQLQGGIRALPDYRKRLQAVTAEEVQRAAAKYLTFANTSVFELEAATAAPRTFDTEKYAATVLAWSPTYADAVDAKQTRTTDDKNLLAINAQGLDKSADELGALESIQPLPVKNFSILNGPQAFVREDHTQPRVNLAILFQGGRVTEDESNSGITELMLRAMLYGSANRTQVAQELEQMGADIEVITEADFYGININVLSPYAARAVHIVRELIEDPAFREEEVKLARDEQLSLLESERDAALARSRQLFLHSLFPAHPYGFAMHGREEVLKKLTGETLQEWHAHTIKRQLPLVIVVGDTEGSALLSGDVATGFKRNETDATLKARVPSSVKPGEMVEASRHTKSALTLGFAGAKGADANLAVIELLKALLNGRSGRLVSALRDQQGLAYEVGFASDSLLISGALYAQALFAPENEPRVRAALAAEFDRLAKLNLSAEELNSAKAVAVTMNLARLQSLRARTMEYARAAFYQRAVAEVDSLTEPLIKISADDVKRLAATYCKPAAAVSVVVRGTPKQQ